MKKKTGHQAAADSKSWGPPPRILEAGAILDRLVHNAYKIKMRGESMRKWYAKKDDPDMIAE